jgi:hypothetical protein
MNIELARPLLRSFPSAKTLFLYRDADGYARSAARAFALFSPEVVAGWDHFEEILPRVRSLVDGPTLSPFASPIDILGWDWSTTMSQAVALQQAGIPMFIVRYEELRQRTPEVLVAILEYCGVRLDREALEGVISRDSQQGAELSLARARGPKSELTEERRIAFRQRLARLAPYLDPDGVLPGTYGI